MAMGSGTGQQRCCPGRYGGLRCLRGQLSCGGSSRGPSHSRSHPAQSAYCKAGRHSGNTAGSEGWVSGCKCEDRQEGGGTLEELGRCETVGMP